MAYLNQNECTYNKTFSKLKAVMSTNRWQCFEGRITQHHWRHAQARDDVIAEVRHLLRRYYMWKGGRNHLFLQSWKLCKRFSDMLAPLQFLIPYDSFFLKERTIPGIRVWSNLYREFLEIKPSVSFR